MSFKNKEETPMINLGENIPRMLAPTGSIPIIDGSINPKQQSMSDMVEHMTAERIVVEVQRLIRTTTTPAWEQVRYNKNWQKFFIDLEGEYRDLQICYPAIFRMAIEMGSKFEVQQLLHFLRLRGRIECGNINENDAHQQVGQEMVDRFVKPMLNKK